MKILLITNNECPTELNQCNTFLNTVIYMISTHLSDIENVEVVTYTYYYKGRHGSLQKSLDNIKFPDADHVILVDEKGFYNRIPKLVEKLRETTTGAVTSLCFTSVYLGGEDMMFYFNPTGLNSRKKTCLLGWLTDNSLLYPEQDDSRINILINGEDGDFHQLLEFYNMNSSMISVKKIDNGMLTEYDSNGDMVDVSTISVDDMYKEIRKINIHLISPSSDQYMMYCSAMCNAVIVSRVSFIDRYTENLLNVVKYDHNIPWPTVFNRLGTDTRTTLINKGLTWSYGVNTIVDTLNSYEKVEKPVVVNKHTINRDKLHRTKDTVKKKSVENKKKKILLQSRLLRSYQ